MAKPVVHRLESELGDRVVFLHADVMKADGLQLADRYSVRVTPTILVLDKTGKSVYVGRGIPNSAAIMSAVESVE